MMVEWVKAGVLICLLGIAVRNDVICRRIPNGLTGTAVLTGLGFSLVIPNGIGPSSSLLGALAGFAVMMPLYLLRAMGAGDVKLMAAVGAFLGPIPALGAALLTFAAGGVLSLTAALWSRSLSRVLKNLRLIGLVALTGRTSGLSIREVQTTGRLPYALAIAVGTGLQLWLATQGSWPFI